MSNAWILIWIPNRETERLITRKLQTSVKELEIPTEPAESRESDGIPKGSSDAAHKASSLISETQIYLSENETSENKENFVESAALEDTLKEVLAKLKIEHSASYKSDDSAYILTWFYLTSDNLEEGLLCLQQHGIGNNDYTSVSVIPTSVHLDKSNVKKSTSAQHLDGLDSSGPGQEGHGIDQKMERFYESVKSRMLVAEVVDRIRAGGKFNFDFLMLLILAGIIAFMGLIENSSVVLVASMLVSPLMGPILAGIFGTVIKDSTLKREGIRNELISLLICILIGLILGLIFCPWIKTYGVTQWPTNEMISRGQLRSLGVGVLIAIPSGAGVALSVLGGNAGSLVGVAISASLLPPAVNCGLFFAMSLVTAISSNNDFTIGYDNFTETYDIQYSKDASLEALSLGLVSLSLTIINIICIIITGIAILKLKEVTPDKVPQSFSTFWKRDIQAHRDYYQTLKRDDPLGDDMLTRARGILDLDKSEGLANTFLQRVFEEAQIENDKINIKDWVAHPASMNPNPKPFKVSFLATPQTATNRNSKFLQRKLSWNVQKVKRSDEIKLSHQTRKRSYTVIDSKIGK